jgi:bile acid:Na+ symporter, BASS family
MEVLSTVFTLVLVVFIVSTMMASGLSATFAALGQVFRRVWLVLLVLVVNFVLVPLLGWGIAEVFSLALPAFVALVLVACSPGGPFGVRLAAIQRGEIVTAGTLQILMAALGSITFPFTAQWILSAATISGINVFPPIPVGRLLLTVVVLQLVPFVVGLAIRNWSPQVAAAWVGRAMRTSAVTFVAVLVLALVGGWREIVDLVGSRTPLAAIVLGLGAIALGVLVAVGPGTTKTTVAFMAPIRNVGPVFAAIGIAFANDPAILAAAAAVSLIMAVVALLFASYFGKKRMTPEEVAAAEAKAEQEVADRYAWSGGSGAAPEHREMGDPYPDFHHTGV